MERWIYGENVWEKEGNRQIYKAVSEGWMDGWMERRKEDINEGEKKEGRKERRMMK